MFQQIRNPADLITRGLTLNKFKLNLNFWIRVPTWLRDSPVSWHVSELKCLAATGKNVVHTEVHCSAAVEKNECVVDLEKFSKLSKVLKIVTLILWRCPWCNGYRRRKWAQRHEFKSWTRLIAFYTALIPLGKVWIQLLMCCQSGVIFKTL